MRRHGVSGASALRRAVTIVAICGLPAAAAPGEQARPCAECHAALAESFTRSLMSRAARTPGFVAEWQLAGRPDRCLECHAPGGGSGVTCGDCHGPGPHPYAPVRNDRVCARCHDAPNENTFRSATTQALREGGCVNCHLEQDPARDHAFAGPALRGFARRSARLRLVVRSVGERLRLVALIDHAAGHALPGGTTGRAVWLSLRLIDAGGRVLAQCRHRYGWEHRSGVGWEDQSLPPGRPTRFEAEFAADRAAARIEADLRYQFEPGPFRPDAPASRQIAAAVVTLR